MVRSGISGWHMHPEGVLGRPDFYFPQAKLAVFVDGCFWHGCPRCYRRPMSRTEYWDAKLQRNLLRDKSVSARLRAGGVSVLRLWEHELANSPDDVMRRVRERLHSRQNK